MPIPTQSAVQMVIADVAFDRQRHFGFLLLREAVGSRVLTFFYSGYECLEIVELACQLRGMAFPLIPSRSLLLHLLEAGEAEFVGSEIYGIRMSGDTGSFYSTRAILRRKGATEEVEIHASEMFLLALALDRPILASEDVVSKCGLVFPPHLEARLGVGKEHVLRHAPEWLGIPWPKDDSFDTQLTHDRYEEDLVVRDLLNFSLYRSSRPPERQRETTRRWWTFWRREAASVNTSPAQYPIPHAAAEADPTTRPRLVAEASGTSDVAEI